MAPPITSCTRCRTHRKKCIPNIGPGGVLGPCERCVSIQVEDECFYGSNTAVHLLPSKSVIDQVQMSNVSVGQVRPVQQGYNSIGPVLEQYLNSFNAPLSSFEQNNWELEDPDLLPTFDDWLLVFKRYTNNGTTTPVDDMIDAEALLQNYFQRSTVIRLVVCLNTTLTVSENFESQTHRYFLRARKALYRSDMVPSLDLVIACYQLNYYAFFHGQPEVGLKFLIMSLEMIQHLKMDIDPDDSPWLPKLTPRQKEERRRVFWWCYGSYSFNIATSPDPLGIQIFGDKVKPPGQVYDPHPIFSEAPLYPYTVQLYNIIGSMRKFLFSPPQSAIELLTSETMYFHTSRLLTVHSQIPIQYLLLFENPRALTTADEDRFISQNRTAGATLGHLNMALHGSTSINYRAIMYLSALSSFHPSTLPPHQTKKIITAINACLESAWKRTTLALFFEEIAYGSGKSRVPETEIKYYTLGGQSHLLFEACVVFWFVVCRMNASWRPFVQLWDEDTRHMRDAVARLVDRIPDASSENGVYSPVVRCIEAMMLEIEEVGMFGRLDDLMGNDVDVLELGMKVMSIGGEEMIASIAEPHGFLGLLGLEVGNRVRWLGRKEESWRLFWKLNT